MDPILRTRLAARCAADPRFSRHRVSLALAIASLCSSRSCCLLPPPLLLAAALLRLHVHLHYSCSPRSPLPLLLAVACHCRPPLPSSLSYLIVLRWRQQQQDKVSVGPIASYHSPATVGAKSKPATSNLNPGNPFMGFSGLEATSSANCELGGTFLGTSSSAFLRSSSTKKMEHISSNRLQVRASSYKVAVLGAAGGIGQPLSLLIKMSPLVSTLHLYDIANVKGVAADLSHCNTPSKVLDFTGATELPNALTGVDVVVIPAGVPRKPGMTRDDLFNINAGIVKTLVMAVADHCPNAFIHIISNPVNSTVPIAAEVLKQKGVYDPKKLFGVTTLDVVRANTFVAEKKNLRLIDVDVPVVGGHAGITILPLLSKTMPSTSFTEKEVEELTVRIQNAGTEVVEAKAGAGSATLSMAYAAARFVESSLRALDGDGDVYECAFVQSDLTELPFFASRVKLGRKGIEALIPKDLQGLTEGEEKALEALKAELKASIEKGVAFVHKKSATVAA